MSNKRAVHSEANAAGTTDLGTVNNDSIVSRETISNTTGDSKLNAAIASGIANGEETENLVAVPGATYGMLSPDWIVPNSRQPRQVFSDDELKELTESIEEVGLLQPIVVRPIDFEKQEDWTSELVQSVEDNPQARYELIMGERRWRASKGANLTEIPAIVRRTEDDDLLRDALIENLHRVQLNPIEEASAYQQLMSDFSCTQEVLSDKVKRSRSQIANTLRLLKLPASVQRQVAAGVLSAGHARALLSLGSKDQMEKLAKRIIQEGLSVRSTEEIAKQLSGTTTKKTATTKAAVRAVSPENAAVARQVADRLDTEVTVVEGKGKSRLIITFADTADLSRIAEAMGVTGQ